MKHLMNTKTEKLTRRGFAFLLAMVLMTSAFVPGLTARATEGETPTLESLKPLKDYETAVALLADLDTIAQALPEDAAKEDIKAVYDTVVAAQTDAEALTGDVALTEEKKAEVAAQAATILTYLTEQRGYVPAEPEAQNDEDEEDETPTCTCPEGTEGHIEGCPLYVAPCGTCGETGTHKADCATLCNCEDKTQTHVEGCPLYVAPCELCGETGTHKADCATLCTCPEGTEGHVAECPLYICADCGLNKCICSLESAYLLDGAVVYKEQGNAEDTKTITGWNTAVKIQSSITDEDGTVWYQFVYSNVLKELLNGYHFVRAEDTTTLKCTCTPEDGEHAEDCALYVAPSAYELAMEELAALEEEVKTLADDLDEDAEDYIEKLTANCNDLYDRLFAVVGEVADLWENDTITDDEYYTAEEKAMEIIQYLKDSYGYENREIAVLVKEQEVSTAALSTATRAESGITFELYNYGKYINYKNATGTEQRDHSKHFIFASAQTGDVDNGAAAVATDEQPHLGTDHLLYKMNLDANGFPVIGRSTPGAKINGGAYDMNVSTDYLFGGKTDHAVTPYKGITNTPLFYDPVTGYYSYNSAINAADLTTDGTKILIREYNERGESAASANKADGYENNDQIADFFPFNSLVGRDVNEPGTTKVQYENHTSHDKVGNVYHYTSNNGFNDGIDYWFGARMHANFYIPQDSQVNGENMQYHFTGDDDVLVYIDGVFVMDLGGAHSRCTGSIDFYTGLVETYLDGDVNHKPNGSKYYIETIYDRYKKAYQEQDLSEADVNAKLAEVFEPVLDANGDHKTVTDAKGKSHLMYRFKDYTLHTFDWFYMERYSGQANFSTYFNLPTVPPGSVKVTKELTDSTVTSVTSNEEYTFQITYADGSSLPTEEKYTIDSVEKTTTNNGQFKLKPGETAVFDDLETGDANGIRYKVTEINAGQNSDLAKVNYTQNTQSIFESTTQNYIEFTLKPSDADGGTDDIAHELIYSNKLKKSDFTVTKKVTGNLGDRMRNFTFHAELYYDSTMTTKLTIPAGTGYEVNAENVAVFQLKHEDSITFENIPNGAYVKIVEVEEEYDTTIEGAESSADRVAFLTTDLTEDNDNVIFTNEKDVTIDTGISLDSIPYIVILVGVAAVVGFLFLRKRRIED